MVVGRIRVGKRIAAFLRQAANLKPAEKIGPCRRAGGFHLPERPIAMKRPLLVREKPAPVPPAPKRRSRRAFLGRAFWGGLGLTYFGLARPLEAAPCRPGWIDAHVHVWTPDTKRYPLAPGWSRQQMRPESFTPWQLLAHARPVGVQRVVLIQMSFYGFDNSYMLDTIRRFPGVFSGVAVIDEHDRPAATMRRLLSQGVRGFRIHPGCRDLQQWIDSPGMHTMWRTAAETGQAICALVNPEALPLLDRMCQRYPDTTLVVDHFGRIGIDGRIRNADLKNLCRLARHQHTYVKVSAYYALGKKKAPYTDLLPMIRRVYEAFGPQRLMWASDCPFQVQNGHTYPDSIDLIRRRADFLSDADRQWILRKTAQRVYFD